MSEAPKTEQQTQAIDFDPILPDTGILFFEECPTDYEIERPKLLPLKNTTQLRFEQLQHEAARVFKEKHKTADKSSQNT